MYVITFIPEYLEEFNLLLWRWLKCSRLWDERELLL